jgi:MFS family permease
MCGGSQDAREFHLECAPFLAIRVRSLYTPEMRSKSKQLHYGWIIVAMGTFVVLGSLGLARFGYTAVLPAMQTGLHMDNTQAGALATANLAGYLLLSAIGGALATRFGPRAVISLALLLVGAGMIMTGLAKTFPQAAFWRGMTGIGSGASNVPVMGLLSAWAVTRRRGLVTGIAVAGSSIALIVVGPFVPRVVMSDPVNGWRMCWFVFGTAVILIAVGALVILRNRPADLGFKPLGADGTEPPAPLPTDKPDWGRIYRSSAVWHLGLVYVAFGFSYIIYMTFFVKRLVAEGEYTAPDAGKLFMVMGWFSLLCGVIWGTVSDVIGRRRALMIVYLVQSTAFGLFALWSTRGGFAVSAILFGLTAWSIPAIMAATCGDVLGPRLAPAALGFITLFFGVGQALGPILAGAMADAAHSFVPAFLLAAAIALLGAIGAALLRPSSTSQS